MENLFICKSSTKKNYTQYIHSLTHSLSYSYHWIKINVLKISFEIAESKKKRENWIEILMCWKKKTWTKWMNSKRTYEYNLLIENHVKMLNAVRRFNILNKKKSRNEKNICANNTTYFLRVFTYINKKLKCYFFFFFVEIKQYI